MLSGGATTEQGAMPAEPQPVVRAAVPADAEPVAAIFAHYVATSVATFEEVAPTAADWRGGARGAGPREPALPGGRGRDGRERSGWGWRVGLRLRLRQPVAAQVRLPAYGRGHRVPL